MSWPALIAKVQSPAGAIGRAGLAGPQSVHGGVAVSLMVNQRCILRGRQRFCPANRLGRHTITPAPPHCNEAGRQAGAVLKRSRMDSDSPAPRGAGRSETRRGDSRSIWRLGQGRQGRGLPDGPTARGCGCDLVQYQRNACVRTAYVCVSECSTSAVDAR